MSLTLKDFFHLCWKRIWIILLCVCVFALGGGLYANLIVKKTYTSELAMVVRSEEQTTGDVSAEYRITSQLLQTFVTIIGQPEYFREVAKELNGKGIDADTKDLSEEIRYSTPSSTAVIKINVTANDAKYALAVAEVIRDGAGSYILERYQADGIYFSVIDNPVLAEKANPTKTATYIVVCALLGLILSVLLILLIYYLDVSVKNERDLTARYDVPVLGVLPKFWEEKSKRGSEIVRKDYLIRDNGDFELVEAYRNLMSNVGFTTAKKDSALCFCVSSSCAGEGKSTIAANLAYIFATSGKRVLLIDGDLRKGRLNLFFHAISTVGLSNYLCGMAELGDVVERTDVDKLDAIYAGAAAPNPIELFQSERMDVLLAGVARDYDYVIIDTPPVEVVADALTLILKTDGVIFVMSEHLSKHTSLAQSMRRLSFSQCKLLGFVLGDSRSMAESFKKRSYRRYYESYRAGGGTGSEE